MRRPFYPLLAAEIVSIAGSRVTFVALPWLVLATTGSAARTGAVSAAETLPYVLAMALGGRVVDRLGSRRLAIAADATSAVVVALVPLLYSARALSFTGLVAVVAIAGAARAFGDLSKQTLLPTAVAASGLSMDRATALADGGSRLAGLLGLPLGGVLIAWLGAGNVLYVDAGSFAFCALVVGALVRLPAAPPAAEAGEGDSAAVRGGLGFLRADRLVLGVSLMVLATNLFDQANGAVFIPVWIRDHLHSPAALGLLGAAFGVGAVAGNVAYTALADRLPRYATFAVGFLIGGSPRLFAMGLSDRLAVVLAVSFGAGVAIATVNPIMSAVAYERIPEHLRGRVVGLVGAIAWAGVPLGGLLGGWAVDWLGLRTALLVAATGYLAVTLAPFALPGWRALDRPAGTPVELPFGAD